MKLLQIDSSARTSSVTRRLTAKFAEEWKKNHPNGKVAHRLTAWLTALGRTVEIHVRPYDAKAKTGHLVAAP